MDELIRDARRWRAFREIKFARIKFDDNGCTIELTKPKDVKFAKMSQHLDSIADTLTPELRAHRDTTRTEGL